MSTQTYDFDTAPVDRPTDTMTLNMGPHHPSTHGVLRVILELDGETMVKITPDIGYLHTGIEKNCEVKPYQQAINLVTRADYTCTQTNDLAYVLAVEKLLGIEVPKRAQWIRVLLAELSRLGSHLIWLGTQALDIGATSVFLYAFREREVILDMFDMLGGARMFPTFMRVGGLAAYFEGDKGEGVDLPKDFITTCRNLMKIMPDRIAEYERLLTKNPIWLLRTRGIGKLSQEDCIKLGVSGPILRATGMAWDLRKNRPYSSYQDFEFDVPTRSEGDVFARYEVRMAEMHQSVRIIKQALENLPPGPVNVADRKIALPPRTELYTSMESVIHHFKLVTDGIKPPVGEAYSAVESSKGEIGCYIVSDGSNKPYRVRIRPPSFVNLQTLAPMSLGLMVADMVAIIASIDIVLGEVDR
jgi:NADH-quinone oxidoreductase subunit D